MATYGSFPGVQVETQSGGITSVAIGEEEKLVIIGQAGYTQPDNVSDGDSEFLDGSAPVDTPEQINARREAAEKFGEDSPLTLAMTEALANGANIDYLYGVAVDRVNAVGESIDAASSASGTLDNFPVVEDPDTISFDGSLSAEFRYDGAPETPTQDDLIYINPLTGQYAVTDGAVSTSTSTIDYKYDDFDDAFTAQEVTSVVNEDETGVWAALTDSDSVAAQMQAQIASLRNDYQLVNGLCVAEPNDNEVSPDATGGADARYDTANYDSANNSVVEEYYYKFAPGRLRDSTRTVMGGVGGLFAGNSISDPIYNEALNGYQSLEQQFSKTDADNMRSEGIIPVRDAGTTRVKGNRSTAYGESDAVAADFWTRRITDRVILIGKQIGDSIIGRINDPDTRQAAERAIRAEMRALVDDRLIRPNTADETNWYVDVYEDSTNSDEVNIDISFTPYGIVKRVDESITIDTN